MAQLQAMESRQARQLAKPPSRGSRAPFSPACCNRLTIAGVGVVGAGSRQAAERAEQQGRDSCAGANSRSRSAMYPASLRPQQRAKKGKRKNARSCRLSPHVMTSTAAVRKVLAPLSSQRNERTVQRTPNKATPTKQTASGVRRTPSPLQHSLAASEPSAGPRLDNSASCSPCTNPPAPWTSSIWVEGDCVFPELGSA